MMKNKTTIDEKNSLRDGTFLEEILVRATDSVQLGAIIQFYSKLDRVSSWAIRFLLLDFLVHNNFYGIGAFFSVEDIMRKNGFLPEFKEFLVVLLELFANEQLILRSENQYQLFANINYDFNDLEKEEGDFLHKNPEMTRYFKIIRRFLGFYFSVLSGQKSFLSVFFENGSFDMAHFIYEDSVDAKFFNETLAVIFHAVFDSKASTGIFNVLEIGAGIGATTSAIFNKLHKEANLLKYKYSDVSTGFLAFGRQKFDQNKDLIGFLKFDINAEPAVQGLLESSYDVIVASNSLHNANDIKKSLGYIRFLLKPGGVLILNEGVKNNNYFTLIFGLSPQWWARQDACCRIEHSPLLTSKIWECLSKEVGFKECISCFSGFDLQRKLSQDVLLIF